MILIGEWAAGTSKDSMSECQIQRAGKSQKECHVSCTEI